MLKYEKNFHEEFFSKEGFWESACLLLSFCFHYCRPDDIQSAYGEMKQIREELLNVEKDITVLSMLIDGTLPDDMKQQGIKVFL